MCFPEQRGYFTKGDVALPGALVLKESISFKIVKFFSLFQQASESKILSNM
jgi:hypothetical protein